VSLHVDIAGLLTSRVPVPLSEDCTRELAAIISQTEDRLEAIESVGVRAALSPIRLCIFNLSCNLFFLLLY
jgi:hypothetical protein